MIQQKSNLQEIYEWLSVAKTLPTEPTIPSQDVQLLVLNLLLEETSELAESGGIDILKEFSNQLYSWAIKMSAKVMKAESGAITLNEGLGHSLDAIVDLVYIIHNRTCFSGLVKEYPEHFEKVTKTNWSKFDVTAKDAMITKQAYLEKGINTHFEEKQLGDTTYYVTYRADKKIMKSHNFKEPQLTLF